MFEDWIINLINITIVTNSTDIFSFKICYVKKTSFKPIRNYNGYGVSLKEAGNVLWVLTVYNVKSQLPMYKNILLVQKS